MLCFVSDVRLLLDPVYGVARGAWEGDRSRPGCGRFAGPSHRPTPPRGRRDRPVRRVSWGLVKQLPVVLRRARLWRRHSCRLLPARTGRSRGRGAGRREQSGSAASWLLEHRLRAFGWSNSSRTKMLAPVVHAYAGNGPSYALYQTCEQMRQFGRLFVSTWGKRDARQRAEAVDGIRTGCYKFCSLFSAR